MGRRLKGKWLNSGQEKLALEQYHEPEENWLDAKKKTYGYRERDEDKRIEFIEHVSTLNKEALVYLDEAGMDSRADYEYGWNKQGERFHALKSGKREGRVNMIAALCNQNLLAPFTVEGV
jgi:hypothetical protein